MILYTQSDINGILIRFNSLKANLGDNLSRVDQEALRCCYEFLQKLSGDLIPDMRQEYSNLLKVMLVDVLHHPEVLGANLIEVE